MAQPSALIQGGLKSLFLCAIGMLATGCMTVGPDFVSPEAPVTEGWRPLDGADPFFVPGPVADDLEAWWRSFEDPILDELVAKARRQNLTLQAAALRILEARAQVGIATGNRYPQVQAANGSVAWVSASENSANFNPLLDSSFREATLGFDAAWELDLWGRFQRGI